MKYDYLVVGAGLFGAVFTYEAKKRGKSVLVIDRRDHIAGNVYTENVHGINVHRYGAHIFHTSNKEVWDYVNQFAEFNNYINSPIAIYKDELYNLPFNMNTFSKLWGIRTPAEAQAKIEEQRKELHITGRIKEMIIRAGENISPREIEHAIRRYEGIADVKVVGVPAQVLQEEIAACVIARPGARINQERMLSYLKNRLADYKVPAYVFWFDAFPMNASGKIDLKELRREAAARAAKQREACEAH